MRLGFRIGLALTAVACNIATVNQGSDFAGKVRDFSLALDSAQRAVEVYKSTEKVALSDADMLCLAKNIFHEAGVEDDAAKIAVAQVTLNRVKAKRWGDTVCKVVYAKAQFSWTLKKKLKNKTPKGQLWRDSIRVAGEVVHRGQRVKGLESSGFYHTDYIATPDWAASKKIVHRVGKHIFYDGTKA